MDRQVVPHAPAEHILLVATVQPLERRLLQLVFHAQLGRILLPVQLVVLPVLLGNINRIRTKRRVTHAQLVLILQLVQAVAQTVMLGLTLLQVLQVVQRA
jgi:hypothetical protein